MLKTSNITTSEAPSSLNAPVVTPLVTYGGFSVAIILAIAILLGVFGGFIKSLNQSNNELTIKIIKKLTQKK